MLLQCVSVRRTTTSANPPQKKEKRKKKHKKNTHTRITHKQVSHDTDDVTHMFQTICIYGLSNQIFKYILRFKS